MRDEVPYFRPRPDEGVPPGSILADLRRGEFSIFGFSVEV